MIALCESLFGEFVGMIAASRDLSEDRVRDLIDDPPITAAGAARAGLIDGLIYRDQLMALLAGEDIQPISPEYAGLELPGWGVEVAGEATALLEDGAGPQPLPPSILPPADLLLAETEEDAEDAEDARGGSAEGGSEAVATEAVSPIGSEPDPPNLLGIKSYLKSRKSKGKSGRATIAVIYCEGQIISGKSDSGGLGGGSRSMGSDTIAAAIRQARKAIDELGKTDEITLIYAGGVRNGGDVAKALALGADAIAIGTSAMMALNCNKDIPEADFPNEIGVEAGYCYHCHTGRCPVGVATQDPKLRARLDPDEAAERVYNFLHTLTIECQMMARACGKTDVHSLEPEDLAALTMEASAMAMVPLAGTQHTVGRPDMNRY